MTLLRMHLGLGDLILCCGLIRTLIDRGERLIVPCYIHNHLSAQNMLADLINAGSVQLLGVPDDNYGAQGCDEIRIGFYGERFDRERFDVSFYNQAGVPFLDRWRKFKIGHVPYIITSQVDDRFLHDDPDRGFKIPDFPMGDCRSVYRPQRTQKTQSIFQHFHNMDACLEIHCINSSFAILADSLNLGNRRYLHRYARPDGGALPTFGNSWTILDKPL